MGFYSEMDLELQREDVPGSDPVPANTENVSAAAPAISPVPAQDTAPVQAEQEKPAVKDTGDAQKDEDAKRKAHEEAEAKRKAEFDAKQAAKKAAEQEQLDRLAAMSDGEVMTASMERVKTDTEKLTRRNMKECVAEYIQTMCIEDLTFARKTMHPRKSMIRCFQYISRKAWEYVQDELKANGIQPGPGRQGYGCDVPDDLCYQWAVDYFNDPDAKEDHEDEEKFVPNPYRGGTTSKSKNGAKGKGKSTDKKEPAPKKAEPKEPAKKSADGLGQISLGDFMMPEKKAG